MDINKPPWEYKTMLKSKFNKRCFVKLGAWKYMKIKKKIHTRNEIMLRFEYRGYDFEVGEQTEPERLHKFWEHIGILLKKLVSITR